MGAIPEWLIYFYITFVLRKKCFDNVPWELSESNYSTEGKSISISSLGGTNCVNNKHLPGVQASALFFPLDI